MTILADEGVDREIVLRLREDGHDVTYVAEMDPGISDEVVLARANELGAILLTQDKDFGELVFRQGLSAHGVVLLRLAGLTAIAKADQTASVFRAYEDELAGAFSVISSSTIRIRHL